MIIVVGASGALGGYLLEQLDKEYEVIGTYRTSPLTLPLRDYDEADEGRPPRWLHLDVTRPESIARFVDEIRRHRHLSLIYAAGVNVNRMAHYLDDEAWQEVQDINLSGAFRVSRALLPLMRIQHWGRIIFLSSVVGERGVAGTSAYAASKAGLFGLTRALAVENATKDITVNCLALGYFSIGMIEEVPQQIQDELKSTIPMKRFGHPRNIVSAVRFLMEASYVTGSIININGGL